MLPATFAGTLPCADCPGIRYHLNLFPDDSFFLRMTYLERSVAPVDDIGSWALSSDRRVLVLKGRAEQPEMFAFTAPAVLRKLDVEGRPIDSRLPFELTRAAAFQPVDVRLTMRGTYSYMADVAMFVECSTGQRWPVAAEAASADLERAYAVMRPAPGAAVLVEVEGLVAQRRKMEGAGTQTSLVVEKIGRLLPRESCAPRFTSAPLTDTYWRLMRLGDRAIPAAADPRRQPSLTFQAPMGRERRGLLRIERLQSHDRHLRRRECHDDADGRRHADGLQGRGGDRSGLPRGPQGHADVSHCRTGAGVDGRRRQAAGAFRGQGGERYIALSAVTEGTEARTAYLDSRVRPIMWG